MSDRASRFDDFVKTDGARLHRALVAAYGPADGGDAAQSALGYGWQHWDRVESMDNPAGYLYRVGQSAVRRDRRRTWSLTVEPAVGGEPNYEPGLVDALASLTEPQRIAIVLVHGYGYRLSEVADVLGVSISTLRNHLRRGLKKLRANLGVEHASV